MHDNPFLEEILSDIQPEPPLAQLEALSSCPVPCCLGEGTDTHLATPAFQVVVERNKVPLEPPFLQADQPPDFSASPHRTYCWNPLHSSPALSFSGHTSMSFL